MAEEEHVSGDQVAVRVVALFVPIVLTAHFLNVWFPKPLGWAVSMLVWMLLIYWLPERTDLSLRRWLIVVFVSASLAFLLATFQPNMF